MPVSLTKKLYWFVIILLIKIYNWFLGNRVHHYRGMKLYLPKNVFSPIRTITTDMIIDYLEKNYGDEGLSGKLVCDMGTGSGVIGIYCAKRGAEVIASDISSIAIKTARINCFLNNVKIILRECDLFTCYEADERFDLIIFNPPFFPLEPHNEVSAMYAAGEKYRKIIEFLIDSRRRVNRDGIILITLSSIINERHILDIAKELGYIINKVMERKGMPMETLSLYKLSLIS